MYGLILCRHLIFYFGLSLSYVRELMSEFLYDIGYGLDVLVLCGYFFHCFGVVCVYLVDFVYCFVQLCCDVCYVFICFWLVSCDVWEGCCFWGHLVT